MALSQIKALFGEVGSLLRLQDLPPCATFYAEDDFSYLTMEGYVQGLLGQGREVAYVTSDLKDPLLARSSPSFHVLGLKALAPMSLSKSKAPLLILTMPDLGSLHVARPASATRCVYVFHSLISTHRGYRSDAFDHYDDFFCTGEYQVRELTRRFEMLGRPCPRLHRVGYYKLDRVHRCFGEHQKEWSDRPCILIAPSWHPGNLLEAAGADMVQALLAQDYRVVVRPHPAFFASIYAKGQALIAAFEKRFAGHPNFILDKAMNSERFFFEADLLVTDWSGAAYEYAFGTERPVLFVDTPPKLRNERWEEYGLVPFEVAMRAKVGRVLSVEQACREAGTTAAGMLGQAGAYRDALRVLRQEELFNFGNSAQVGTELLGRFLEAAA
jgi:YidC/Oxa1 family membrane protein insertase